MKLSTAYYDGLSRTPAFELAMRGHLELLQQGRAEPVIAVCWDHKAIVCLVDDEPVGVITFQHTKWQNSVDIYIGYVLPEYRRCGVYRLMWEALVARARDLNVEVIIGATATGNAEMRATAKSLGRSEIGVLLKYVVPPAAAVEGSR